ncbi:hypothetical protein C7S18_13060 [Ahniella affigens]|uniref:Uncharacterized protein n=1 Tax=Ahniella affigens TaxID=2021234 RepID=A0A2P1PTB2_9GAMM|nr:pilin [Ahniella affigens]AVP98071.1 hypothetical protein C7S18_13060 [Ahniella affigens]
MATSGEPNAELARSLQHLKWMVLALIGVQVIAFSAWMWVHRSDFGAGAVPLAPAPDAPNAVLESLNREPMPPLGSLPDEVRWMSQTARIGFGEYLANTGGVPPADNAALGLAPPESYAGRHVKSVTVQGDGKIVLAFQPRSGRSDFYLTWTSDYRRDTGMSLWRCETNLLEIRQFLTECEVVEAKPAAH